MSIACSNDESALVFDHGLFDRQDYSDAYPDSDPDAVSGVPGVRTAVGVVPVCSDPVSL